jgi:hypothetical protein
MDAAADTVLTPMLRTGSALAEPTKQQGPVPYLISDTEHRDGCGPDQRRRHRIPQGGLQLHPSDLRPVPRQCRRDPSDVVHAGPPPGHRLLRSILPAGGLRRDPRRPHGAVASVDRLDQREAGIIFEIVRIPPRQKLWRAGNGSARRTWRSHTPRPHARHRDGQQGGADRASNAAEIGHEPTVEELAERLAMPRDKVHKVLAIARQPIRLETAIGDAEDSRPG